MITGQRKKLILDMVRANGQVAVQDLSELWSVSEDAIRRDLRELSARGLLQRVHGGAISSSPAVIDYNGRERISTDVKKRLGKAGSSLVQDRQVVAVDGGTTTLELVRHLPSNLHATVVTHSPIIAAELRAHEFVEVILLGGRLFKHSMVATGPEVLEALGRIHFDIFFLGATGIHPETGATTGDWEEASVKRMFCSRAAETVLMASPEKLNAASSFQIVPASEIDALVVDVGNPGTALDTFEQLGITILRADEAQ